MCLVLKVGVRYYEATSIISIDNSKISLIIGHLFNLFSVKQEDNLTMSQTELVTVDSSLLKTEERIIMASMKVFSQCPLNVVSLRMIAKEAGITLSLISYHYKSKENLYQVVLRRILTQVEGLLEKQFEILNSGQEISTKTARHLLAEIIDFLIDKMFVHPKSSLFVKLIFQEHMNPSGFYEELYRDFFKKAIDLMGKMIQIIVKTIDDRRAAMLAFGIIGQIFGFRLERELMVRHLGIEGYSEEETREIRERVVQNAFASIQTEKR